MYNSIFMSTPASCLWVLIKNIAFHSHVNVVYLIHSLWYNTYVKDSLSLSQLFFHMVGQEGSYDILL